MAYVLGAWYSLEEDVRSGFRKRLGMWEVPMAKLPIPYFYLKSILTFHTN